MTITVTERMISEARDTIILAGVDAPDSALRMAIEAALAAAPVEHLPRVNDRQVETVWARLNVSPSNNVTHDEVRAALTLATIEQDTPATPTMSRAEILALATKTVNDNIKASAEEGTKGNGYKADSYRYPTIAERTQAILELAAFLAGESIEGR